MGDTAGALRRVAVFLAAYFAILFVASVPKGMVPRPFADLVWGTLSASGVLALTLWMLRRDRRSRSEIGLDANAGTAARLLAGMLLGVAVYAATVFLSSVLLGPIHLTRLAAPSVGAWALTVASFLALSCMEELGFRAYALRTLLPAIGEWPAQGVTAVAFGAGHLLFGWSWSSVLFGVIPSAILFGVAAVRSGGLAFPIGLHAAVNLTSWTIGAKDTLGLWRPSVDPVHEARMGTFAPFVGLGVTLLVAVLVARWPEARGTSSRGHRVESS